MVERKIINAAGQVGFLHLVTCLGTTFKPLVAKFSFLSMQINDYLYKFRVYVQDTSVVMQALYSRSKSSEIHIWYRGLVLNLGFWGPVLCKWSQCQPVSVGVRISDAEAKIKIVPSHHKPVQPVKSDKSSFSRNCPSQKAVSHQSCFIIHAFGIRESHTWVGWLRFLGKASKKGNGSSLAPLFCLCPSIKKTKNAGGELCPLLPLSLIFLLQGGNWNSCH